MKDKFKCWVESIKLNQLLDLEFKNENLEYDINSVKFSNYNLIDLIISNLPIPNLIILKIDNELYINEFEFILFMRNFLDNKLHIECSDLYINDIKNKTFDNLDESYKEILTNTLLYCNVIDLNNNNNKDIVDKIINKYIN